jgi:hypothetical protein
MRTLLPYLIVFVSLAGCSKSSSTDKDTESPVITMISPLNNQSFTNGQTVTIAGSITDNKYIAEVHIVVSDLTTGATYVHVHLYPASGSANFNQDFTANTGINYKIQIIAVDRSLNQAVSSVQISCN